MPPGSHWYKIISDRPIEPEGLIVDLDIAGFGYAAQAWTAVRAKMDTGALDSLGSDIALIAPACYTQQLGTIGVKPDVELVLADGSTHSVPTCGIYLQMRGDGGCIWMPRRNLMGMALFREGILPGHCWRRCLFGGSGGSR